MNNEIPCGDKVGERQLRSEIEPSPNNARYAESVWQRDDLMRLDLKLVPNEPLSVRRPMRTRQRDVHRRNARLSERQRYAVEQRRCGVAEECGRRHPKLKERAPLAKTEILGSKARASDLAIEVACSQPTARDDRGCSLPRKERLGRERLGECVAASHRATLVASRCRRSPHPQPRS